MLQLEPGRSTTSGEGTLLFASARVEEILNRISNMKKRLIKLKQEGKHTKGCQKI